QEGFLGFDLDYWSGKWRGWDKVNIKRRDKLREVVRKLEGEVSLVHVLEECEHTVRLNLELSGQPSGLCYHHFLYISSAGNRVVSATIISDI
ncbi:hypothetical protein J6590_056287, partial [Homalodisca vitripennis]